MEGLILLLASFIAVADAFALALHRQHILLVTKLTFTNVNTAHIFVRVCKFWCANLRKNNLSVKIMILHHQGRPHILFYTTPGKLNARVNLILFSIGSLFNPLILKIHSLNTDGYLRKTADEFIFAIAEPQSDILWFNRDIVFLF